MADFDVVVVGAGAAGVGAGLELKARGVSSLILEADLRVGGRAYTDRESFSRPWDQGCHWLHCADVNPLVGWANRLGSSYVSDEWIDHFMIWTGGGWSDRAALQGARQSLLAAFDAIDGAAERGDDRPVADVIETFGPWQWATWHILRMMLSEDPERVSAVGAAEYDDTGLNWPVTTGYGDLIERMARGLPVRMGTPVRRVEQTGSGVTVHTPDGSVTAKAAIVTASTNVLRSGAIDFATGPARSVLDFVEDVPCGVYEKVAVALDRQLIDDGKLFCTVDPRDGSPAIEFQNMPGDPPLMIAHIAGGPARDLTKAGPEPLVDLVVERLTEAFGAHVRSAIIATAATDWQRNPYVLGGYSYAKPRCAHRRRKMIAADTGNVVFAGEAFSLHWQATAHGAYQSGCDAASRLVDGLAIV